MRSAIRSAGYALRRLNLQDERAGLLVERVDRQTTAIARMLEDLLDASRIAFGKASVRLESFDLRSLLRDALDEQQPHARQAGLQLIAHIPDDACIVNADRVRLRQIVDNLLSNALKFTPAGGNVELTISIENDSAVVLVRDTGIGFDSTFAERLFEPYVQHEQGRARSASRPRRDRSQRHGSPASGGQGSSESSYCAKSFCFSVGTPSAARCITAESFDS